jgi:endonuclease/exonuclease/phosphatase family metal-dependent hydrolase
VLAVGGAVAGLVIGDFNEASGDPRADEVFAPFLSHPDAYAHLTWPLAQAGTFTFLPAEIMLDHVVATTVMVDAIGAAVPEVPRLDQEVADYATQVSDHLPVVLRLPP